MYTDTYDGEATDDCLVTVAVDPRGLTGSVLEPLGGLLGFLGTGGMGQ